MKHVLVFFLMVSYAHGSIPTDGDSVLPFQRVNVPLVDLIKEYAEALNKNITFDDSFKKQKTLVSVHINQKTPSLEFSSLIKSILDSYGYTILEEEGFNWIMSSRDIRYTPTPFYKGKLPPNDESYAGTFFYLKFPVAREVARNLRPFVSRYGRVLDLPGGKTLLLVDKGETTHKLKDVVDFMDNEKLYKSILERAPSALEEAQENVNSKIVDLEIRNKILEKKVIESNATGGVVK